MQNLSASAVLKDTIQLLETEQAFEKQMLKEQFYSTYERLKPANLLRSTLQDFTSAPYLIDHILSTAVGLATGYLSKKIVVGTSGNIIRKLLGILMQVGVTNTISQHPDKVKSIGQFVYRHFLSKKKE
jgi:hypothetical protein